MIELNEEITAKYAEKFRALGQELEPECIDANVREILRMEKIDAAGRARMAVSYIEGAVAVGAQ